MANCNDMLSSNGVHSSRKCPGMPHHDEAACRHCADCPGRRRRLPPLASCDRLSSLPCGSLREATRASAPDLRVFSTHRVYWNDREAKISAFHGGACHTPPGADASRGVQGILAGRSFCGAGVGASGVGQGALLAVKSDRAIGPDPQGWCPVYACLSLCAACPSARNAAREEPAHPTRIIAIDTPSHPRCDLHRRWRTVSPKLLWLTRHRD